MKTIAIYNLKGGVGKTTVAINLAGCAVTQSRRRTLLWDLDPQAAATFMLSASPGPAGGARAIFAKEAKPEKLAHPSTLDGLDLIAADTSLRGLDRLLYDLAGKKRLTRLLERLEDRYERVILDCPPGLGEVAEHVLRAADVVIVPVIPSPLSARAFDEVATYLASEGRGHAPLLPVYSMVDRRRALHRAALEAHPDWPVIPMASAIEQIAVHRAPVAHFAPSSPATLAFRKLWTVIERRLAAG